VSLFVELQRRRVFRALVGYGIAAFAVLQIIEPIMHGLHWPDAVLSYVVVALAIGFPIVVGLAWIFDVKAGRIERTAPAAGLRGGRLAAVLVGVGVLAALPGVYYYLVVRGGRSAPAAAGGPSIAVLPLTNLSSDKEQEYFSDGLAEELLNLLAKVPGLRVAARTSAFAFKGKNEDVVEIARKLHVATVLEGSVRRSGDQIRITTQLINASDGYHLWSETYDRKFTDVFAVQDEIATAVVNALKLKLLQAPSSKDRRTVNAEAYNQYLLGRQFFFRSNWGDYRRAMQAYRKAVELDPTYAPAWAGLADATYWVADNAESAAAIAAGQEQARAAAEKAVALGPDLADGYLARGFIRASVQWDWAGAGEDLERAFALAPENADVLFTYATVVLRLNGRLEEAAATLRKAIEIDPLNARFWSSLGSVLVGLGKLGPAREALNRSLEISPEQSYTAAHICVSLLLEGRPADALAISQRSSMETFRLWGAALAHHDLGHTKESQQALAEMIAKYAHSAAYQIAGVYAWRGEKDRAFEWLERARAQHDGGFTILKTDPVVRGLRGDPRWRPLLKAVNLPAD
jgi:TolB-like protein